MQNVEVKVEGNILVMRVDLTKDFGPSKSGKSNIVGSTGGFVAVPEKAGFAFGLNVVKKRG